LEDTVPNQILIVDDSVVSLHILRSLFKNQGEFTICGEAQSGREAVKKSQECHPDLIIIDYSMPGMNGSEAATKIRQNHPTLPIIMLTDFKGQFLEQQASKAGITLVLSKADGIDKVFDFVRILLRPATALAVGPLFA
jgi:DNA-binding NarL/FixJ family response regulator